MKTVVMRISLAVCLTLSWAAIAQMDETQARDTVVSMLDLGRSPTDVVGALVADGRDLIDATIFSLVVGGQENRTAFAKAGISAARSLPEAEAVANALIATAGATGPVAATVADALEEYRRTLEPPPGYSGSGIATGGGNPVSPSD